MNTLNTFTSTGSKLIYHPKVLGKIINRHMGTPMSLQIAPTSRCNLNCVFCSNVNRSIHEDLDVDRLMAFLFQMSLNGAKTVEWTGGGDPTMYEYIHQMVEYSKEIGYQQGMITNGIKLVDMEDFPFELLKWMRISMNGLDYMKSITVPDLPTSTILGFSYVMNRNTTDLSLQKLHDHVEAYQPDYVRIVPDCQCSLEQQKINNKVFGERVAKWGSPFFYQPKMFKTPVSCYWGYFKPFLLHDGWIYPCSSVVLNDEAERSFHSKYRWAKMEEFEQVYKDEMKSCPINNCSHCVFYQQNKTIIDLLNPNGMEDFV